MKVNEFINLNDFVVRGQEIVFVKNFLSLNALLNLFIVYFASKFVCFLRWLKNILGIVYLD